MARVYLSYARPDHDLAAQVSSHLSVAGVSVCSDQDLNAPDDWTKRAASELDRSTAVIVLWTNNLARSEMIKREVYLAIAAWSENRLALVALDNTPLPPGLRDLPTFNVSRYISTARAKALNDVAVFARVMGLRPPSESLSLSLGPGSDSELPQHSIFISFSSKDHLIVSAVVDTMKSEGFVPWLYTGSQDGHSDRYATRIVRAIKASRKVAVMCSGNAFESDEVVREIYVAGRAKKPFVTFFLDREPGLEGVPEHFEYFLSGFPFVPVHGRDEKVMRDDIRRVLNA